MIGLCLILALVSMPFFTNFQEVKDITMSSLSVGPAMKGIFMHDGYMDPTLVGFIFGVILMCVLLGTAYYYNHPNRWGRFNWAPRHETDVR